jgi:hypothetical protein
VEETPLKATGDRAVPEQRLGGRPGHDDLGDVGAGRSKDWIKVKNRGHPALSRVMEAFR